jgi:hypothetical protein
VVAASISVTRAGAREGMPTLAELEAKLAELGILQAPAAPAPVPDPEGTASPGHDATA